MAKKKEEEAPAGSPAWMATFSDLMNLLLCFFVLLFSMSSVDAAKYDQVVQSLSQAFSIINTSGGVSITQGQLVSAGLTQLPDLANYIGDTLSKGKNGGPGEGQTGTGTTGEDNSEDHGSTSYPEEGISQDATMTDGAVTSEEVTGGTVDNESFPGEQSSDEEISTEEAVEVYKQKELSASEKMAQEIEALTVQYGIQDLVQVDFNGQYVRITLNGALLFDSGSAELVPEALPLVEKIARIIDVYTDSMVEIEGHTDNVPIHSSKYESNDVLSMYRALYVSDYVRQHSVIDPANIISSGRGSYVPIADNSTAEGRARNRRVEVKIYNSFNSEDAEEDQTGAEQSAGTSAGSAETVQSSDTQTGQGSSSQPVVEQPAGTGTVQPSGEQTDAAGTIQPSGGQTDAAGTIQPSGGQTDGAGTIQPTEGQNSASESEQVTDDQSGLPVDGGGV